MTLHRTEHDFVTKDKNTKVCACGVTLTGLRYKERIYYDAAGNKTMEPPHCSLKRKKEPEPVAVAHEAKKIECIAFIFSVYDKLFKGNDYDMDDSKWALKQSAETILQSNGVTI